MRRATPRRPAEHVPSSPLDARAFCSLAARCCSWWSTTRRRLRGGRCLVARLFRRGRWRRFRAQRSGEKLERSSSIRRPLRLPHASPSRESARGGPRAIRRRCSASGAWRARAIRTSREQGPRRGRSDRPAERSRATPSDPHSPTGRSTSFTSRVPPSAVFSRRKASCTSPIALRARYAIRSGSTEIT